jgi:hypothetical protein
VITESAVSWLRNDFKVGDSEPAERAARRLQTLTFGRLFRAILSSAEAADQWEAMIPLMVKTGLPPLLARMARRGAMQRAACRAAVRR